MSKRATADVGRAARFPRGHCGRTACRCTHTEGCDHGWVEGKPYTHRGVRYAAPQEPCPACRPDAATRLLEGSTQHTEPASPPPAPPSADDLPPELWERP